MENVHYRHSLIAVIAGLGLLAAALIALPVSAQSGCVGDPCLFYTPTATTTSTPRPTEGPGTPTAVPMPGATPFPRPFYGIPTSIPVVQIPTANSTGYTPPTMALPSPIVITYTPPAFATPNLGVVTPTDLLTISTDLSLSYNTPLPVENSEGITGTEGYTSVSYIISAGEGLVSDTVSYTLWISGEAAGIIPTDTFTVAVAPDWYAPPLPRPMANIGWTFETLQGGVDTGRRYSLASWASFFGYMISLPVQFIKMLLDLADFLGPLGLFIIWLLIMLPFVLFVKVFVFIKNLFISLFNFIIKIARFFLDLVK